MKNIFRLIVLPLFILGCQNSITSVNPEIGKPFKIKLGQTLEFQGTDLSITFEELLEDSRCPEGATCVWAGNGRVSIKLNELQAEINTYLDPKSIDLSDYEIKLLSLSPYPEINNEIEPEEYILEMMVSEK
jgi:hypothetical protein